MPRLLNTCLRRLREQSRPGESQAVVAEALGIQRAYLTKVETGILKCPSTDVFERMMDLYGCSKATRYALSRLMWCDGGPGDAADTDKEPADFVLNAPPASWFENFRGLAADRHDQTTLNIGGNVLAQYMSQPGAERIDWLISGGLPRVVISEAADRHGHRHSYAIAQQSLLISLFREWHWLNVEEFELQRLSALLLDEPDRVFVAGPQLSIETDVAIVEGVMAFRLLDKGAIATSGLEYSLLERTFADARENALPPNLAVEYLHKLRRRMIEVREALADIGDCKIVRKGGVVEVVEKKKKG